ncbi:MFS transporter [Lysobacter sp. A6]|uniref:MFS transporter n=1 Tax=Noviluteimonas lactosilytica TaxID=2888523 RepID=A0ABS8JDU0_9GAMM|nr:MFS transporter [Lysobacter lactosilyticus]MCC8361680.1 MFS transporter [Lysobacter lactosilyticus]
MSANPAATGGVAPSRTHVLGGPMAWWVWTLSVIFVVYLFSFQTGYSIVNPNVQKDVGLSIGQVSTIAAVYTWAFAICQFFGGALLDKLGARAVLPISIALVTLGIFVFANANSYGMLLLSQVIIALGSCTGFVGAGYIGGQWFGMAKFSFMFGLVQVFAALTSAFSVGLIFKALGMTDWRTLFNGTAIFGIVLFVLGLMYIKNPTPVPRMQESLGTFFGNVLKGMAEVAKIGHVWVSALQGAFSFGAMLALGVVWMPKLLQVHGIAEGTSNLGAALLWLGLAAGSAVIPWWSDHIKRRKTPIILGAIVQLAALLALVYMTNLSAGVALTLCFLFGYANAAHMLAFSTAADVVQPHQIGTSAAIVNGIMFILGGVLISRPGMRIGMGLEAGLEPRSLELAQYASLPLLIACGLALLIALFMKETYPRGNAP